MPLVTPPADWIFGIDTSTSQGRLDVPALLELDVSFVIAKASDGEGDVDSQWPATAMSCSAHGMPLGAYGVLEDYGIARARGQAQHFVETVRDADLSLPPVLDFELCRGGLERATAEHAADLLASARAWVEHVEAELGRRVLVYTYPSFFSVLVKRAGAAAAEDVVELGARPLWVAHYTQTYVQPPTVPLPWTGWEIWQASGDANICRNAARLPGSGRVVDIDFFRGTVDELLKL